MSRVLLCWIALSVQILFISASSIPACKLSDAQCLKNTAQSVLPILTAGIPDIGTDVLDELHVKKIKFELSGLKLSIKDAMIKGLSKSVIQKVNVDTKKKVLKVVYRANAVMSGKYKASGQLLILPISGDGDMTFVLKNLEVELVMPFEIVKNADGKNVIDLKSFTLNYDVKDNAHYDLTNLFNGNKELSDAMLQFMNSNWKILTQEFGTPILEAAHKIIFDAIKKYLATQPLDSIE